MATNKLFRLVVTGSLVAAFLIAAALLSCDRRHAVNTPGTGSGYAGIGNIIVTLSPAQIRLSSFTATDSAWIVIAVIDSQGVGIPGVTVRVTRAPAVGFVTQPDTTNSQGITVATFIAEPGVYDSTRIFAEAGSMRKSALLVITGPTNYSIDLNYSPPVPKLIDHEAPPYTITASLVDSTQRGVTGQQVTFAIINEVGRIGFADSSITIPRTNSQGQVEALFFNTQTDEMLLPDSAMIQVVTPDPSGHGLLAASITIPLRQVHNSLTLEASPRRVFGDGGDTSLIRAFLLDTDGHGIVGDTVRFRDSGHRFSVQAISVTNDNGIATSKAVPLDRVDRPESTAIIADYRSGSIVHQATAGVYVTILPIRTIGYITVSLQKQNVRADGVDSSSIFITVQDSTGGLIADGTIIHIDNTGIGFLATPQVSTVAGQARTKITSPANINGPPSVKIDSIFVWGAITDSSVIADTAVLYYVPGPISQMQFIRPESTITLVAGSGQTDTVLVYAVDANGNPVGNGTQITFRNDLVTSSLTPEAAATNDGVARSIYLVGSGTGDDNVVAFSRNPTNPNDTIRTLHPVVYRCVSSEATTLQLDASQSNIEVGGASTQIIATLQDAYGNPLREGYQVAFDITVAPGSRSNPGERPSFDTQFLVEHDTMPTNINGQAIVQLYSGTSSGAVSIRACTIPLPPESLYVCNEKAIVTISSGPPDFITITFSYAGEAVNPNTPERFVQVGAIVGDRFSNPVEYGTAVYFSLIPSDLGDIEGNSYTGGARSYHPDSTNGVAYTRIIYGCFSTFVSVRIIASSAGDSAEVVDTSGTFFLPIFGGAIAMTANPGALWTDNANCGPQYPFNNRDTSAITATLSDDGGCPIEGGIILFSAQVAGFMLEPTIDTTDVHGRATARYVIRGCDIPLLPSGIATIETSVRAVLEQKPDVVGEINITCSRNP